VPEHSYRHRTPPPAPRSLLRGLTYGLIFSVPLWAALLWGLSCAIHPPKGPDHPHRPGDRRIHPAAPDASDVELPTVEAGPPWYYREDRLPPPSGCSDSAGVRFTFGSDPKVLP